MLIVLKTSAQPHVARICRQLSEWGISWQIMSAETPILEQALIATDATEAQRDLVLNLSRDPIVERVVPLRAPYLHGTEQSPKISIREDFTFDGRSLLFIAGPCAVESESQVYETVEAVAAAGAHVLRGGAFKPRTSTYSFQGMGVEGLEILSRAGREHGLLVMSEVLDPRMLERTEELVDIIQIGSRNMQNFSLLKEVGGLQKPVLLKRGMMATIDEWLMAAEYILAEGNPNVILCERGIRTFERATRFTLDLNAVPVVRSRTHLPIVVDPSHGTGYAPLVIPMARAAIAAGADGVCVEVHPRPIEALSDGVQALTLPDLAKLARELDGVAKAVGRAFPPVRQTESPRIAAIR